MKKLIILLLSVLFFQTAKAQKRDTLIYYMRNSGQVVKTRDSADYFMLILPVDSVSGKYPVNEYYLTGKQKLITSSLTNDLRGLKYDGVKIDFFENGRRQSITNYKNGEAKGDFVYYFPNGNLYYKGTVNASGEERMIECRDTTGKILAAKGNGGWINYDYLYKNIITKGNIIDSLKEGEWYALIGNKVICKSEFSKNKFISGVFTGINGDKQPFKGSEIEPVYNDATETFGQFLARNIRYPDAAKKRNIQGKVFLNFVIERDGTTTNVNVLRSPDQALSDEAVRVVSKAIWIPGFQNGLPVRVRYTMPVSFTLNGR